MVEALSVNKVFGDKVALKDFSIDVREGEIFGLIGPDGAGKTTFIRIAASLLLPDTGSISISGMDVVREYKKIRDIIGYVPGRFSLYQDLTVEENLKLFATIFGTTLQENYYLIKDIYQMLEPFKDRRAGNLSGGMKQKLALSCALIHKPKLLLLDEPTTGVDPVSRKEFWEMLGRLKKEGITILVSTPYMDEASQCERVALMQAGSIMTINNPERIVEEFPHDIYSIATPNKISLLNLLRESPDAHSANLFGDSIHFIRKSDEGGIGEVREIIQKAGFQKAEVQKVRPQIEDCFIDLMQNRE